MLRKIGLQTFGTMGFPVSPVSRFDFDLEPCFLFPAGDSGCLSQAKNPLDETS